MKKCGKEENKIKQSQEVHRNKSFSIQVIKDKVHTI